ncbi:MAG: DUF6353 family protein [bacterium]|nr:DUF6353 family protein [bacterium]
MNKNGIMKKVSGTAAKVGFKLKKHSPEIFIVAGIVGTVVSGVMACKATTKVSEILEETKETLDTIHEGAESGEINGKEYTVEDSKKDTTLVYVQTGMKFVKLYAPAAILGALSIASIVTSHNILRKRNIALAAAYTAVDTSFKDYRKRVIERFGDEIDKELRYNVKAKTFKDIEADEDGKEKTVEKTVSVVDENLPSDYARWFDHSVTGWENNHEYNMMFLRAKEAWANDKLKADGFIYLNDIYYELGIQKTKAGQIVGWVDKPNDPDYQGDGFVDFGVRTVMRETAEGGYEEAILLDFNPDGNILDLM